MTQARDLGSYRTMKKQQPRACTGHWDVPGSNASASLGCLPNTSGLPYHPHMTVSEALKQCCNIRTEHFAMIYVDEDKNLRYETSPLISSRQLDIFTTDFQKAFVKIIHEKSTQSKTEVARRGPSMKDGSRGHYLSSSSIRKAIHPGKNIIRSTLARRTDSLVMQRKHSIPQALPQPILAEESVCSTSSEDDDAPSDNELMDDNHGSCPQEIKISDTGKIIDTYKRCFKLMQQLPCKTIAKCWVKTVEPKKQAHHPYNGGQSAAKLGKKGDGGVTKPDWWPKEGCRHKEPDHITKPERLELLIHILRNLHDYQGQDGKKITVDMLRQSTDEIRGTPTMTPFVKKLIDQLYYVREQEERHLRGEIQSNYAIVVQLPEIEPKEAPKATKSKPATKRVRTRAPSSSPEMRTIASPPSAQDQNLALVVRPSTQVERQGLKEEPMSDNMLVSFHKGKTQPLSRNNSVVYQPRERQSIASASFSSVSTDQQSLRMDSEMLTSSSSYQSVANTEVARRLGFLHSVSSQRYPNQPAMTTNHSQQLFQSPTVTSAQDTSWQTVSSQNFNNTTPVSDYYGAEAIMFDAYPNQLQRPPEMVNAAATNQISPRTSLLYNNFFNLPSNAPSTAAIAQSQDLSTFRRASLVNYSGLPLYNDLQIHEKPYMDYQ